MSLNYYDLFIEQCMNLSKSICVKVSGCAKNMNDDVITNFGINSVNTEDPTSWKYYQNICGLYHFSDKVMKVYSLDTQEEIVFSKDTLELHPLTKAAYIYQSNYYKELIQNYPDQEILILGILYPADMHKAVEAKDGTILAYPTHLVEDYEDSLIIQLQDWLYAYFFRWINSAYNLYHNLYPALTYGQMALNILQQILLIRLKSRQTSEVHEFFIRQYLASHHSLDEFIPYLTRQQQLYFYKNIRYIEKHAGSKDVFSALAQELILKRNMKLYEFFVKHDISELSSANGTLPLSYYPTAKFNRRPLFNTDVSNEDNRLFTIEYINSLLRQNAKENDTLNTFKQEEQFLLTNTKSSTIKTKLVHCIAEDNRYLSIRTILDIAINHWMALSYSNEYSGLNKYVLNKTKQDIYITTKEAVYLFLYALNKAYGVTLEEVPDFYAYRILKQSLPTTTLMQKSIDKTKLTQQQLLELRAKFNVRNTNILTRNNFYDQVLLIFDAINFGHRFSSYQEDINTRAYVKSCINSFFSHIKCNKPNLNYEQWLLLKNLKLEDYSQYDFLQLAQDIALFFTGIQENKDIKVKEMQNAMLDIFKRLSSYSVAFTSEYFSDETIITNPTAVRANCDLWIDTQHNFVHKNKVNILDSLTDAAQLDTIHLDSDYEVIPNSTALSKTAVRDGSFVWPAKYNALSPLIYIKSSNVMCKNLSTAQSLSETQISEIKISKLIR